MILFTCKKVEILRAGLGKSNHRSSTSSVVAPAHLPSVLALEDVEDESATILVGGLESPAVQSAVGVRVAHSRSTRAVASVCQRLSIDALRTSSGQGCRRPSIWWLQGRARCASCTNRTSVRVLLP